MAKLLGPEIIEVKVEKEVTDNAKRENDSNQMC